MVFSKQSYMTDLNYFHSTWSNIRFTFILKTIFHSNTFQNSHCVYFNIKHFVQQKCAFLMSERCTRWVRGSRARARAPMTSWAGWGENWVIWTSRALSLFKDLFLGIAYVFSFTTKHGFCSVVVDTRSSFLGQNSCLSQVRWLSLPPLSWRKKTIWWWIQCREGRWVIVNLIGSFGVVMIHFSLKNFFRKFCLSWYYIFSLEFTSFSLKKCDFSLSSKKIFACRVCKSIHIYTNSHSCSFNTF